MHMNLAVSDRDLEIYAPSSTASDYTLTGLQYLRDNERLGSAQRALDVRLVHKVKTQRREASAGDASSSDDATTVDELEHFQARLALVKLVDDADFQSLSYDADTSVEMNPETVSFARKLLSQLTSHQMLPKIAPDGEGDLMMVWDHPPRLLITVEGKTLHAVAFPGTTRSRHLPSVKFDGEAVPSEIAALIPKP